MNAQQLRNSILQEAIEGRLVPQDPNDEPASALLERIREEKRRLVKEGKLKKKDLVETPISEDEKPFEIPESWEWVRIKSIFSMQAGKNVTSADINSEQNDIFKYPCYGGNGLRGYVKGYNTEGTYPLVGRQGALCGNINIASGQFWATEHAVVTDGYGMTPYKWQYYFLVALNLNQYATATAQPGLAVSNIIEVPFPLPPLAEQKRIVAKIEELMPKVEEYGKAQEALDRLNSELPEKLKKSILQEAIEGRLVPQDPNDEPASVLLDKIRKEKAQLVKEGKLKKKDLMETPISEDEIPFEIPESWEWVRLGDVSKTITKGTTPRGGNVSYSSSGIGFLRAENVAGYDKLDLSSMKYVTIEEHMGFLSRSIIEANDILITIAGTLGRTALVNKKHLPLNSNQAVSIVRLVNVKLLDLKYLIYAINEPNIQEILTKQKKVTAIPNLTLEIIRDCLIPLPPLAEQHRIVARIEKLMGGIEML